MYFNVQTNHNLIQILLIQEKSNLFHRKCNILKLNQLIYQMLH